MILDLRHYIVTDLFAVFVITGAGFGGNGKALGDGQTEVCHLGQVCALAAEKLSHPAVALRKEIYVLFRHLVFLRVFFNSLILSSLGHFVNSK